MLVRESGQDELSPAASDLHTDVRELTAAGESALHLADERRAEVRVFDVVVVSTVVEFAISLFMKANTKSGHRRARARAIASSAGINVAVPAAISALRRSAS